MDFVTLFIVISIKQDAIHCQYNYDPVDKSTSSSWEVERSISGSGSAEIHTCLVKIKERIAAEMI